jgi:hypothetical protein
MRKTIAAAIPTILIAMSLSVSAGETKGSHVQNGAHSSPPGKSAPKEHPSLGHPAAPGNPGNKAPAHGPAAPSPQDSPPADHGGEGNKPI